MTATGTSAGTSTGARAARKGFTCRSTAPITMTATGTSAGVRAARKGFKRRPTAGRTAPNYASAGLRQRLHQEDYSRAIALNPIHVRMLGVVRRGEAVPLQRTHAHIICALYRTQARSTHPAAFCSHPELVHRRAFCRLHWRIAQWCHQGRCLCVARLHSPPTGVATC